jgi:hypothetical protein
VKLKFETGTRCDSKFASLNHGPQHLLSFFLFGGLKKRPIAVKRAAGGMSEDNVRCFSTLVLGAFSTGVFQHQCITPH